MNLEQLKAKYAKGNKVEKAVESKGTVGKAWSATKEAATKTTGAVRGTLPVTSRRFEGFVADITDKVVDHDKELFKQGVMIELIAQQAGIELPTNDQLEAYYEDYTKQQEAEAKAKEPEVTEDVMLAFLDKVLAKVGFNSKEVIDEVLEEVKEEQTESPRERRNRLAREKRAKEKQEAEEAAKKEEAPKKEEKQPKAPKKDKPAKKDEPAKDETKPKGRRRLGRQAPLAN